jgi:hypothetical protein
MTEMIVMGMCGLLTHFLKDLVRIRAERGFMNPKQYFVEYPYQTLLSIIGAVVGYIVLESTGQLNEATAFGAGYMSNSFSDIIGKRSLDKI